MGSRVEALIQARMSSRRLPGKVLKPLAGRPMVCHVVDRIRRVRAIDGFAVVTSVDSSDDVLDQACREFQIPVERGPLNDVARRFLMAAVHRGVDTFVRVNGDSPFLDPDLIDEAVAIFKGGDWDVVTNVFPRSFPPGQSVEVVRTNSLARAIEREMSAEEAEHVTRYFYGHPGEFRIRNFVSPDASMDVSLCVDRPEDWPRAEWIAAGLSNGGGWREALALARSFPGGRA